uniref:Uncharacterized protein n=1 Tax=Anguilla anguilla TaxID=7936 RepID=A0A0E9R6D3_ANGAN
MQHPFSFTEVARTWGVQTFSNQQSQQKVHCKKFGTLHEITSQSSPQT